MFKELVKNKAGGDSGITVMEGDQIIISHSQVAGKEEKKVVVARYKIPNGTPMRTFSHAVIFEVEGELGMKDGIGGMLANPVEA